MGTSRTDLPTDVVSAFRQWWSSAGAREAASITALTLALASGCAHAAPASRPSRALSPDSLALLHGALRQVRPAFFTQEEALRAGVYHPLQAVAAVDANGEERHLSRVPAAELAGGYVIQIAAYRDRTLAERVAAEAQRRFSQAVAVVEVAGETYRVGLAGWESAPDATAELPAIRRVYPGVWVRRRGVS